MGYFISKDTASIRKKIPRELPGWAPNRALGAAERQDAWYDFLEGECRDVEGLLCFYDHPRTRRVKHLCRFYATWLGVIDHETEDAEAIC